MLVKTCLVGSEQQSHLYIWWQHLVVHDSADTCPDPPPPRTTVAAGNPAMPLISSLAARFLPGTVLLIPSPSLRPCGEESRARALQDLMRPHSPLCGSSEVLSHTNLVSKF